MFVFTSIPALLVLLLAWLFAPPCLVLLVYCKSPPSFVFKPVSSHSLVLDFVFVSCQESRSPVFHSSFPWLLFRFMDFVISFVSWIWLLGVCIDCILGFDFCLDRCWIYFGYVFVWFILDFCLLDYCLSQHHESLLTFLLFLNQHYKLLNIYYIGSSQLGSDFGSSWIHASMIPKIPTHTNTHKCFTVYN